MGLCITAALAKLRSVSKNTHKRAVIGRQLASGTSRYKGSAVIMKTFPV